MNIPTSNDSTPTAASSKGPRDLKFTVFLIIAAHAVFFGGLLLQGCKRPGDSVATGGSTNAPVAGYTSGEASAVTTPAYSEPAVTTTTGVPPSNVAQQGGAGTGATATQSGQGAGATTPRSATPTTTAATQPPVSTDVAPAPATHEYKVVKGDTPARIAKAHKVSTDALLKANPGLDPKKLHAGQKIAIPASGSAASTGASTVASTTGAGQGTAVTAAGHDGQMHEVKPGDNLTKIAQKYGVKVKAIRTANGLKTDRLQVGQKLKIPAKGETAPASAPQGSSAGDRVAATAARA